MMKEVQCPECNGRGYIPKCETWDYGNGLGGGQAWSEICQHCHGTGVIQRPMTNADHIRSMTDEELMGFLFNEVSCGSICEFCVPVPRKCTKCDGHCRNGILSWLKQPYDYKEEV